MKSQFELCRQIENVLNENATLKQENFNLRQTTQVSDEWIVTFARKWLRENAVNHCAPTPETMLKFYRVIEGER